MTDDIILDCVGVHHAFGAHRVLHDVNLRVVQGSFVGLVGPSGCGKSTLLRAIVGTHPPRQGRILIVDGEGRSTHVDGPGRDRGIVYQRYSLFPFLTAMQNVALGLMLDQTSIPWRAVNFIGGAWRRLRREHLQAAEELLVRLGMANAINRYPHELSGGMCQRVAVAQALIMKPRILLLDEPFGALDESMRSELQRMLLRLYAENLAAAAAKRAPQHTILIVTHELNEAIYVGDRVVGLSQYWNWADQRHAGCPGATIVYDDAAPVYSPDIPIDFVEFTQQREAIRSAVFDPAVLPHPDTHCVYWQKRRKGVAV